MKVSFPPLSSTPLECPLVSEPAETQKYRMSYTDTHTSKQKLKTAITVRKEWRIERIAHMKTFQTRCMLPSRKREAAWPGG